MTEPITATLDDPETAREEGRRKMDWARQHMPILDSLWTDFERDRPLAGETVGMAMHVEAKTAVLAELLAAGGAEVAITGCNPLSTHDDVSAALDAVDGVTSYAERGVDDEAYYAAIEAVIAHEPSVTVDDGMDLVAAIHEDHPELVGKTVVVAGYGHCGKGVAKKAAGQNADVVVTEVEPRRALEAHMEGYDVMPMAEAAEVGDVFITTTGNRDVIVAEHFERMDDGVLLANAGHFDIEVDLDALSELAVDTSEARDGVRAYEMADGRRLNVLAEGRLVNLATPVALGHPVEVMDQSFGIQAVVVRELVESAARSSAGQSSERGPRDSEYVAGVHEVPDELDREVAEIKLAAEGVAFDGLTDAQREYMDSWQHGT
ncbi:adenosylhomocysteinase [Halobacteriales archaeon QH_8_68_33]|nr:MAG: adenosylhomocysteinase [Halobacteriales archaeon QH_8_68_33]